MTTAVDPLDALRPIRVPASTFATGEELLFAALLGVLLALVLSFTLALAQRHWSKRAPETEFLAVLQGMRAPEPAERLAEIAAALRRYVAQREGPQAAAVQGKLWLATLDRMFATDFFSQGPGSVFGQALYVPRIEANLVEVEATLGRLLSKKRR